MGGREKNPVGRGAEQPDGVTWARRAGSGIRVRETREPGQALRGLWGGVSEVLAPRPVGAEGEGPSRGRAGRRAHLRSPWEPPDAPASQRAGAPGPPRGFEPPRALPRGGGPATPGGRARWWDWEKDLLDLGHGGHFPSSGIWLR